MPPRLTRTGRALAVATFCLLVAALAALPFVRPASTTDGSVPLASGGAPRIVAPGVRTPVGSLDATAPGPAVHAAGASAATTVARAGETASRPPGTAGTAAGAAPQPPAPSCDRACTRRPGPPRIMNVGDSLMAHLAPKVERRSPGWEVSSESRPGTGLVADGKIRYDWLQRLRELVAERDPDVVVGWWMGVYWHADGREASAEELRPRWTAAVEEAHRILTSRGAVVHWVLTPHMLLPNWDRIAMMVNEVYRGVAARNPSTATVIDAKTPLDGPGDTYAQHLPDDEGRLEQVRDDDGVHLTDAGVERFWGNAATAFGRYDPTRFRLR